MLLFQLYVVLTFLSLTVWKSGNKMRIYCKHFNIYCVAAVCKKSSASTNHSGMQPKSVCLARSTWPAAVGIQWLLWGFNASVCFQITMGSCGAAQGRAGRPREQQPAVGLQKHVGWVSNSCRPLRSLEWGHTAKSHVFSATCWESRRPFLSGVVNFHWYLHLFLINFLKFQTTQVYGVINSASIHQITHRLFGRLNNWA